VAGPAAPAANITDIVHVALTARELPQLFEEAKLAALAPVMLMPEIASAAVPVLDKVMDWAALVWPTLTDPNDRLVGATVKADTPRPVPARGMVVGDPG
jgi:hypothetical protein